MSSFKRGRPVAGFEANGGIKKVKSACPFGEGCHFLHHVPGDYNASVQMMRLAPVVSPAYKKILAAPATANGCGTRMCGKLQIWRRMLFCSQAIDLHKAIAPSYDDPRAIYTSISGP